MSDARVHGSDRWRAVDGSAAADLQQFLEVLAARLRPMRVASYEQLAIGRGSAVLDHGCGTGIAAEELADLVGTDGRVVAADFSQAMVDATAARCSGRPNVTVHRGDIRSIDLESDAVDAARCERVVMHLAPDEADAAIGELVRVTRPGGRVAVLEPCHAQMVITGAANVVATFIASQANPYAGLRVRAALARVRCTDVTVTPFARVTTSLAELRPIVPIERVLSTAVEAGRISEAEAADELAAVEALDDAGGFICSTLTYLTAGTVT